VFDCGWWGDGWVGLEWVWYVDYYLLVVIEFVGCDFCCYGGDFFEFYC